MSWTPFPLVRITIFFMAGILLAIHTQLVFSRSNCILMATIGCVAYLLIHFMGKLANINKLVLGCAGLLIIVLLGFLTVSLSSDQLQPEHLINHDDYHSYDVRINSFAEERKTTWRLHGTLVAVHGGAEDNPREAKILLYFPKDSFEKPYSYGDVLHIQGHAQLVRGPSNPGEFDYRQFLAYKNIFHQHYIRSKDSVTWLANNPGSIVYDFSITIRSWAHRTLTRYIKGEKEQAIASALILGVKDGLDTDLMQSYAASGAMHVLAVSGLHVGIVYLLLTFVLRHVERLKGGKWTVALIIILTLWLYAMVTGMSPSVIRSVTMFTFVAFSKPLNRSTNIFNLLAAAAFVMLCVDPFLIMSVGFQLSFIAVSGIVYFHPRLYALWSPESGLLDRLWQLTSVSVSAQLATFPLGLYYFHQFPVYFLLANLFVIPAAFLILVGGLILLTFGAIASVAKIIGICLGAIIATLNYLVGFVEDLPVSSIQDLVMDSPQCLLTYLIILSITAFLIRKRFSWVIILFVLIVSLSLTQWKSYSEDFRKAVLIVYDIPRHTAIEFIEQGQSYILSDNSLVSDSNAISFHIKPNRVLRGVKKIHAIELDHDSIHSQAQVLKLGNTSMLWIKSKFIPSEDLLVDYLVISNNALRDYAIPDRIKAKTIILDSSNSYYFADRVLKSTSGQVFSVKHGGAFQVKL